MHMAQSRDKDRRQGEGHDKEMTQVPYPYRSYCKDSIQFHVGSKWMCGLLRTTGQTPLGNN